ncbi:MAG TPA: hypothetical protein VN931_06245 [Fibrobacteria bacterium]|nr:hypothetical protein [Fibrobacteria bacterium]
MRRAPTIAAFLLLAAARTPWAWSTTSICVDDLSGRPYPKATVSYEYHNLDGGPRTMSGLTDTTGCLVWDGGGSGFDSIWNLRFIDSLHLDTIQKSDTITNAEVTNKTIPNQSGDNYSYKVTDTLPFYTWTPSSNAADSGTFIIPGVPQQIIYDPPGDGSYASLAKGASFSNSVTTSFGYGAGASLTAGYSFDAGVASADVEVSASVDYKHNTDNQFTATVQTNNSMNTGTSTDPSAVGPGRGDLFVVPTLTMHWHLYYSHVPTDPHAYSDGNVYKLFYEPIANAQNVLRVIDASNIPNTFDTATAARLLGASVIDPKTHRIRDSLVDHSSGAPLTSRLTLLNSLSSFTGGGGSSEQDSTGTVTQQTTVSYSVDIGASASAKIGIGGATAGATLTASLTMGGQSSTNNTYSRTIAMALSDANPWDVLTYRLYRDNVYGVYAWDVDSTQSWTSLPFEAGYSSPSVAWKISNDHDTLRVDAGQDTTFHVAVQNLDRSQPALDTMLMGASLVQNSGLSASVDPSGFKVALDSTGMANVTVSNPPMGVYKLVLALTGTVNSGAVQALTGYDTMVLVAGIPTALHPIGRRELLSCQGRTLQVGALPGVDWTLRSVDARGRLLQERTGHGPSQVELPQADGLVFTRLVTSTDRADLVTSGVR